MQVQELMTRDPIAVWMSTWSRGKSSDQIDVGEAMLVQRKTGDGIGHTLAGICQRSASHTPVAAQIG